MNNTIGQSIANDVNLCFADALYLFAMATGANHSAGTDTKAMTYSFKAQQIGYSTTDAAMLFQSIRKQLPIILANLRLPPVRVSSLCLSCLCPGTIRMEKCCS